ncbi:peroxisomal membrane anchor protein [Zymoseptoria brevis]|uniref:Peroxisomal membrane anchor protein n=1 Tax=Zymoseptoria brevis TaxID=1047168 RepID=A0A0F4GF84_9PEZI|nr:peroxisomal membrane anchor protein [Zymoseptoria brevis]
MSDNRPKPSIPAWQRAAQPKSPPRDDPVYAQAEAEAKPTDNIETTAPTPTEDETPAGPVSGDAAPEMAPSETTSSTTATRASDSKPATFEADDFTRFSQQQQQYPAQPPPAVQQRPAPPPIITYPEFLVEAHKPPPLITPSRVINAIYLAGGLSAILYGASKWLITPMVDNLCESRHEFLNHSQTKVDELNERLSKIVSKLPEAKKQSNAEGEIDDTESDTSDSTELYHRDMGTQTESPLPSRSTSVPEVKKTAVDHETTALSIMQSHFAEMLEGSDRAGESAKDRLDGVNKLRHYLDGLIYNTASMPMWQAAEDGMTMRPANGAPKNDGVEDLKKEIRGVKGVLLSAKRFPARPVAAGGA